LANLNLRELELRQATLAMASIVSGSEVAVGSGEEISMLAAIETRWTLLRQAHAGEDTLAGEARRTLVLRYLPAIRRFVGAILKNDAEADDLSQEAAVRLLAGDFAGADPTRGRFRDLLRTALRNMIRTHWTKRSRSRGVPLPMDDLAEPPSPEQDAAWAEQWRQTMLEIALNAMEQYERDHPGSVACRVLRLRAEFPEDTSEELAERLSQQLGKSVRADALRQRLHRARAQLADLLIAEVAKGLASPTPEAIEQELIDLRLVEFLPSEWKRQEA
jgi:RNA polymerase sigma factor (sigma-70 family)